MSAYLKIKLVGEGSSRYITTDNFDRSMMTGLTRFEAIALFTDCKWEKNPTDLKNYIKSVISKHENCQQWEKKAISKSLKTQDTESLAKNFAWIKETYGLTEQEEIVLNTLIRWNDYTNGKLRSTFNDWLNK